MIRLAVSPASSTGILCNRDLRCAVLTPKPALNMSMARRSRSSEMWIFAWKNGTLSTRRFLIHKPGMGKTAAAAYALIKHQSKWWWMN